MPHRPSGDHPNGHRDTRIARNSRRRSKRMNNWKTMIHPETGAIEIGGVTLGPETTEPALLASPLAAAADAPAKHGAFTRYRLPGQRVGGEEAIVTLTFDGPRLERVELYQPGPAPEQGWDDWSEEKELARKARHDAFLAARLGPPPYVHAWGKVESVHDARGGSSSIIVSYGSRPPRP